MIAFSFFAIYAALLGVYVLFLMRMRRGMRWVEEDIEQYANPASGVTLPSLTVVVAVRNEKENLAALLQSLHAQSYPQQSFEIILVDDHSDDGTGPEAQRIIDAHGMTNATLLPLDAGLQGKKAAIAAAIARATGEVILSTDADCIHDPGWVAAMTIPFTHGADIVAGPVVISERGSLFARLQALDFLGLMGVGAGFFGIGFPRLCNGANLAYRKAAFLAADGFAGNEGISSGDDEFLLHKIVYKGRGASAFTAAAPAVVRTPPAQGLGAFLMQRTRWASKTTHYADGGFVAFLVLLFVFYLLAALLPAVAFLSPLSFAAAVTAFILKSWIEFSTIVSAARLLRQPIRLLDFFIAELVHPFYLIVVTIAGTIGVGSWKERKLETKH